MQDINKNEQRIKELEKIKGYIEIEYDDPELVKEKLFNILRKGPESRNLKDLNFVHKYM